MADNHDVDMAVRVQAGAAGVRRVAGRGRNWPRELGRGQQHKALAAQRPAALPHRTIGRRQAQPGGTSHGVRRRRVVGRRRRGPGGWLCARAASLPFRPGAPSSTQEPPAAAVTVSGVCVRTAERLQRGWRGRPARVESLPGQGPRAIPRRRGPPAPAAAWETRARTSSPCPWWLSCLLGSRGAGGREGVRSSTPPSRHRPETVRPAPRAAASPRAEQRDSHRDTGATLTRAPDGFWGGV